MNPGDVPGARAAGTRMVGREGQGPVSGLSNRMGLEVVYQLGTPGGRLDVGKGKVLPWGCQSSGCISSRISRETQLVQFDQIRKEESWEHLTMMGLRRIREPSEIKWGLRHEGKFFSRFSLHLLSSGHFPPRGRFLSTQA